MNRRRRFTILDGMIFVAAVAVALALVLEDIRSGMSSSQGLFGGPILHWIDYGSPLILAPLTIAVLLARLRPPRPQRRRLWREPGFVACAIATLMLSTTAVVNLALVLGRGELVWSSVNLYRSYWLPLVSPAMAGAWVLQKAGGRWRPERTWLDRAGRCLGALWIVSRFVTMCGQYWVLLPVFIPFR